MKRSYIVLSLTMAVCILLLWPGSGYAAPGTVNTITVNVTAAEPPPARIGKRMTASVATVGQQILIGRAVEEVSVNQAAYEKLVKEIFDRVLVGYAVEQVTITPGASTHIAVAVAPWGDVVRDVALEVDLSAFSPDLAALIKKDMGNVEDQANGLLVGLPIDAVDWAGGVSKAVLSELLANQLPEFRANFDITAGQRTVIKLSLVPTGPVIQDVNVALRSRTIPNLLLAEARPAAEEAAGMLRGLPVAFVDRHRDFFTAKVSAAAANHPMARKYGLQLTPVVNPGTETQIVLNAETTKYRVSLEGRMDIGRDKDNTSAKLHFGRFISKQDEAFLEVDFIPSSVTWEFEPGWGHKFSEKTMAGVRYNFSEQQSKLWLNQDIGNNWTIRLERNPKTGDNELGVRYKLHEFLSTEYVITNDESWLRIVANL